MMNNLKKINKSIARKLYYEGQDVYLIPHKLSPNYLGGTLLLKINNSTDMKNETSFLKGFDGRVDDFVFFNCTNHSVGKYPSYYVRENKK